MCLSSAQVDAVAWRKLNVNYIEIYQEISVFRRRKIIKIDLTLWII